MKMRLKIYREKKNIISKKPCWVLIDYTNGYLYTSDYFFGLIFNVVVYWKHDRFLVG